MFASGNPALNDSTFESAPALADRADVMTVEGTINRTILLLVFAMVPAYMVWNVEPAASQGFMFGGLLLGLLFGLITCFKASWAPVTGPIYAIAEGCFLGAISRYFNEAYPGIAVQAMCLTFGTMFAMLILYRTGVIKATRKFQAVVLAAGSAIFLVYMVNLILHLFGSSIPFIHETGPIGIAFSAIVVVVAALFLILDFDFIAKGSRAGAPKYMEWYGAFGLMVTLVWLYISFLRLLAMLRSR